jgi:heme-degrading monooxygenase HmoA
VKRNRTLSAVLAGAVMVFALFGIAAIGLAGSYRSGSTASPVETTPQSKMVVARMWHGRTLTSKADEYYVYLKQAGIDKIEAIKGNLGAQVLRRTDGNTTEFTVISYWDSREAIKQFAGDDIEKTHFLPKDPQYLLELEPKVKHFDVLYDGRK